MDTILFSLVSSLISGLCALCLNKSFKLSNYIGGAGAIFSSLIGFTSIFAAFRSPAHSSLKLPWPIPYGSFSIAIDPLGALFLFAIFILSAAAALYGIEYLSHYYGKKNIGSSWFFFNILVSSMVLVVTSRNALLFLIAWELMSISSFFLVIFEGEKKEARKAGLIYLIATHIGTLFLLVMFLLLGNTSGSFDFDQWKTIPAGLLPSIIFILAVIGFGTKAGFMPMHIWLPEAHPAAPSHVSAVMSGVMIKTGIYGLIRTLTFLGMPCAWWGYLLIIIGVTSGVLGVLFALAQHDLKRLLAYHSIENIGIISIGIGLGVLGMGIHSPILIVLGFAGGLLHVVNHAFFKGLLFLGSGVILHQTGTREIDALGGLLKKMPVTGFCFLIGAAAISGLPPLNGFISEFLIYLASFRSIFGQTITVFTSLLVIMSLALIGSLAVACFTKAFSIIFLGSPRSAHCQHAHEPGIFIRISMITLAAACVIIGLSAPFIITIFGTIITEITGIHINMIQPVISQAVNPLRYIVLISLIFFLGFSLISILRGVLLRKRKVAAGPTWDCGYAEPNTRMQYTASSYAQPVVDFFKGILKTQKHGSKIIEYFPGASSFKTETADMFHQTLFSPLFKFIQRSAEKFTWLQHGRLQFYILYIFFTLIALLIWKL